jgi:hypothetical protein
MRTLNLSYDSALTLARQSRPLINPNPGFERQLRIWEECKYEVYAPEVDTDSVPSSAVEVKPAYKAWKRQRDELFSRKIEEMNNPNGGAFAGQGPGQGETST